MQPPSGVSRRIEELDALRGFACVLVTLAHFHVGSELADRVGVYAQHAVELFFVISGFVICMTLERTTSVGNFAIARLARLYPAYVGSIALIALLRAVGGNYLDEHPPWDTYVKNLMMWHPLFGIESITVVFWTLWVELKFYVIVAPLAIPRYFKHVESHAAFWLSALVVYECAQRWLFGGNKIPLLRFAYGLSIPEQCHYFVSGIVLFRVWASGWTSKRSILLLACLGREFMLFNSHRTPMVLLVWCIFLALIAGKLVFLNRRPLLFLGKISYSMYLVHAVCGSLVINLLASSPPLVRFSAALLASLLLAAALSLTIEYPGHKAIRQLFLRRPRSGTKVDSQPAEPQRIR